MLSRAMEDVLAERHLASVLAARPAEDRKDG